jgi:hypothetical protein
MGGIRVTDVPSETIATLRRRASSAHLTLQEYLRARLIEEAATPTLEEVLERAGSRADTSVSFEVGAEVIKKDRDRG